MGSDPAPFMANLFLFYYENKFIKSLKVSNTAKARKFSYVFRFIDDLNSINDYGEFEQSIKDIYPPELELGKENGEPTRASFLDLDIKIVDQVFVFNQYDKRDDFPFSIVRLPFACSNMPSKIFYSSVSAEILRIGRTSSSSLELVNRSRLLLDRMMKQGSIKSKVSKALTSMYKRHSLTFQIIIKDLYSPYYKSLNVIVFCVYFVFVFALFFHLFLLSHMFVFAILIVSDCVG